MPSAGEYDAAARRATTQAQGARDVARRLRLAVAPTDRALDGATVDHNRDTWFSAAAALSRARLADIAADSRAVGALAHELARSLDGVAGDLDARASTAKRNAAAEREAEAEQAKPLPAS